MTRSGVLSGRCVTPLLRKTFCHRQHNVPSGIVQTVKCHSVTMERYGRPPTIAPIVDEKAEGPSTRQATRVCGVLVARRHVSFTWRTAQWPVQPEGPWWSSDVGLVTRKRQKAVEVDVRIVELLPGAGAPAKPQSRRR